uniref:Uncharacterized protein n=1 Tax=Anguilla anguilla TaxID=7936 RepID=A0A0E9VP40_ANGAN
MHFLCVLLTSPVGGRLTLNDYRLTHIVYPFWTILTAFLCTPLYVKRQS